MTKITQEEIEREKKKPIQWVEWECANEMYILPTTPAKNVKDGDFSVSNTWGERYEGPNYLLTTPAIGLSNYHRRKVHHKLVPRRPRLGNKRHPVHLGLLPRIFSQLLS